MKQVLEKCRMILSANSKLRVKASILLSKHFKCLESELYYKYQKGEFPYKGQITNNIFFFFHGLGCSVKNDKENWSISLEFGPKGNAHAFDAGTILYLCDEAYDGNDIKPYRLIEYLVQNNVIQLADKELYDFIQKNPNFREWSSEEEEIDATVADRFIYIEEPLEIRK